MQRAIKVVDQSRTDHANIQGWGADLDPANRPGVPREYNHENVLSPHHHRPIAHQQKPGRDVNLTLERGSMTPIFGDTVAPGPVSTPLRKFAFRFSEDRLRHWLLLLLADRADMVEGWFEDVAQGKMPMLLPRMEFRTTDHLRRALKQGPKNRQDQLLLAATAATALGVGYLAFRAFRRIARD